MIFKVKEFSSAILFNNNESKTSLEEKISIENFDSKSDITKISLTTSQSTKSTTHFIQSIDLPRQTSGLMTKATLTAINKVRNKFEDFLIQYFLI